MFSHSRGLLPHSLNLSRKSKWEVTKCNTPGMQWSRQFRHFNEEISHIISLSFNICEHFLSHRIAGQHCPSGIKKKKNSLCGCLGLNLLVCSIKMHFLLSNLISTICVGCTSCSDWMCAQQILTLLRLVTAAHTMTRTDEETTQL